MNKTELNQKLIIAAFECDAELIKRLLADGAEINAEDELGRSALHEAAHSGDPSVVKLLIDAGADMNAQDGCGYTPLDFAQGREAHDKTGQVIAMLKAAGAE